VRRVLFNDDHDAFRQMVRDFVAKEIVPNYADWEQAGQMPREVFAKLGALGILGMAIPEEYGGSGQNDYRYNVILQEEAARALGLSHAQALRYVILPQAVRNVLPPLTNEGIALLKDSSLVSIIGMAELTRAGQELASQLAAPLAVWPMVALFYLVATLPLTRLASALEKRLHRQA